MRRGGDVRGLALLCRARTQLCALPLDVLVETMRPLPVAALPEMPAFVRGLSILRGRPVPVVDAGALLGRPEPASPSRYVTLRAGERRIALAVEEVLELRELGRASLEKLPPLLEHAERDVVSAVGALDSDLLLVLRSVRLVPESVWRVLEARGGS